MLSGSSPITDPLLLRKHTRSQGPLLHRHYPASTLIRPCPTPARPAGFTGIRSRDLRPKRASPDHPQHLCQRAVPSTPADRDGCICRLLPHLTRPSPKNGRVGIRYSTFEACSGFTHVTARWLAQPPKAAFVAGLRPARLPGQTACQLPVQPTTHCVDTSSTGVNTRSGRTV